MIQVEIEIFGLFKYYASKAFKKGVNSIIVEDSTSVFDLPRILSLPENIEKIVLVNERYVPPNYILKEGDHVKIFSPVPGG